ncbi:MAG TPA: SDR family oxidoreductase [Rugosimonospora sp.]|nr:SDR family oxidoreductase [Rugosimonospora sp.]
MAGELHGEIAVVTGALGRLGTVWITALLRAGADVVGIDNRGRDRPLETVDADKPGRYLDACADVTSRQALRRALSTCTTEFGPPTVLVNNAGLDQPPSVGTGSWLFEDVPDELSASVMDVNALGVLRVCQIFGPAMVRAGRGSIVNIGSLYGYVAPDARMYEHLPLDPPFLKPPAYGMSKAGVSALTRYLAALWGPAGVRVNTLSPGGVLGNQDPAFRQKFTARVPLRRMATEDDLTGPLLFLASDQSRYVTGSELVVDGGYLCW